MIYRLLAFALCLFELYGLFLILRIIYQSIVEWYRRWKKNGRN